MGKIQLKGILWGLLFLLTAIIYLVIPTHLVFKYWRFLNEIVDIEGKYIYTYALLAIFGYIISNFIVVIYIASMLRAFVQCNKEEDIPSFGIPKGVKGFALVSSILLVSLMIIWYMLFQEIAIFALKAPV